MKYMDNRGKTLAFGDIQIGDLFDYEGILYMKTDYLGDYENEWSVCFNAIELTGCGVDVFSNEQLVKKINYRLTFED